MIRNCIMIITLSAASLFAALGSGPFFRTGVGIFMLSGTDLDLKKDSLRYEPMVCDAGDYIPICSFKDESNKDHLTRPVFLVGYEYSFVRAVSVTGGLGLSFTGVTFTEVSSTVNGTLVNKNTIDDRLRLTYITMPVEVKLMLPLNSGGFHVTFGPTFAYLASVTFENRIMSKTFDERDQYAPFAVSLGGSLGGEVFIVKDFDLLYGFRIDAGVTDIHKSGGIDLRPVAFTLEAGVRWTLDRHEKSKKWPL